ncbi:MAG: asparagine synthase (glutamine-hydrolyzing) [Candidatus Omnitrophota bacterium]|nr:MAG: asparagine synthase (glutamine-hydrolyzing) [Candidatus Omnitrophota bacterium]
MCGIVGIYYKNAEPLTEHDGILLNKMLDILQHRGPDDRGLALFSHCGLGHVRLSIIDLSACGHQPMFTHDQRVAVVFNGEIYNYVELREELVAAGYTFRSETDTEVILHAYQEWGERCTERFIGMWAFAIFDIQRDILFLSRDRFGIKPLYLIDHRDVVVFASEIKALRLFLAEKKCPLQMRPETVKNFFQDGLLEKRTETFFHGIQRFPRNWNRVWEGTHDHAYPFWDLPARAHEIRERLAGKSECEIMEIVRDTLLDAVRIHMRSDVPVGVCLSGGIDSSTVVACASNFTDTVNTFSGFFELGPQYDERRFSRQVNERYHTHASEHQITADHFFPTMSRILYYLDEPMRGMSILAMYKVMEGSAERVKVVLDGQGGDEVWAGYDIFRHYKITQMILNGDQQGIRREAECLARILSPEQAQRMIQMGQYRMGQVQNRPNVFSQDLVKDIQYNTLCGGFLDLLRNEDRMSMAFSIESRLPLLDHRLVELGFGISTDLILKDGWSKYILRKVIEPMLPREIVWRSDKLGYTTPQAEWLRNELYEETRTMLLAPNAFSRNLHPRTEIEQLLGAHRSGEKDHSDRLWKLLCCEIWCDGLRRDPFAPPPL